jgi:hypothetical protein
MHMKACILLPVSSVKRLSDAGIKIDGRMVATGRVPRVSELVGWLKSAAAK